MRPRPGLSPAFVLSLALLQLGVLIALAPGARAQSDVPGTWSTDPQCSVRALRVIFGRDMLTMERNGHTIYRGGADVAISDDQIAVRLAQSRIQAGGTERPDPERNVIRFSRGSDALRMVATPRDGAVQHPRVPPLYPCRAAGAAAGDTPPPATTGQPASDQ